MRPLSLKRGGEPRTGAVEDAVAGGGQPPHKLTLNDQPQVGPGLLVEEYEGEELSARSDGLHLLLPGHVVQDHRVTPDIRPGQQETIQKLLR